MKKSIVTVASKHQQLSQILRDKIASGEFPVGAAFPSENVIARDYGVAVGTVREALSALTQQRLIVREQGRGTRVAHSPLLHPGVSFIADTTDSQLFIELSAAIQNRCAHNKIPLDINLNAHGANRKHLAYNRLRHDELLGVLLGPISSQTELDAVLQGRAPLVPLIVLACLEQVEAHFVTTDRTPGVVDAVEHLYALGHRRIAMLCDAEGTYPFGMNLGFLQAVKNHGLSPDECPVLQHRLIYRGDEAQRATRLLFENSVPYSALIVHNDAVALEVMLTLSQLGLRVPEDVSLIGCDNIFMARHASTPLTTVDLKVQQMGEIALETLRQLAELDSATEYRQVVLPSSLVLRQTTAAMPRRRRARRIPKTGGAKTMPPRQAALRRSA